MKCVLWLLSAVLSPVVLGQGTPELEANLRKVAEAAARFPAQAVRYMAKETLQQKVAAAAKSSQFDQREIVSWYGFQAPPGAPHALREYRKVQSIGGRAVVGSNVPHEGATDFGQLLLLFALNKQSAYAFSLGSSERIGADPAKAIHFKQRGGDSALTIAEGRKHIKHPLAGELWVRESDGALLRITLTALRRQSGHTIRDEARVDYQVLPSGTLVPAAVVHRQFVDEELTAEDVYRYSDWHEVDKP